MIFSTRVFHDSNSYEYMYSISVICRLKHCVDFQGSEDIYISWQIFNMRTNVYGVTNTFVIYESKFFRKKI